MAYSRGQASRLDALDKGCEKMFGCAAYQFSYDDWLWRKKSVYMVSIGNDGIITLISMCYSMTYIKIFNLFQVFKAVGNDAQVTNVDTTIMQCLR